MYPGHFLRIELLRTFMLYFQNFLTIENSKMLMELTFNTLEDPEIKSWTESIENAFLCTSKNFSILDLVKAENGIETKNHLRLETQVLQWIYNLLEFMKQYYRFIFWWPFNIPSIHMILISLLLCIWTQKENVEQFTEMTEDGKNYSQVCQTLSQHAGNNESCDLVNYLLRRVIFAYPDTLSVTREVLGVEIGAWRLVESFP